MNSSNKVYTVFAVIAVVVLAVIVAVAHLIVSKNGNSGASADASQPATLTMTSQSLNTASVGDLQHITWTSSNYAAPTVAINIIRKTSDSPATYELVRQVASSTKNDGDAVWVPALSDVGNNTYVQVACVQSAQACTAAPLNEPVAVVNDGRFSNTAAAYQAIEAENNN